MIKLLIVEDDQVARAGLAAGLRHLGGYQLTAVASGEEALSILAQDGQIDLVVLDYLLPGIDGLETCKAIRLTSNIPIIFLSALGSDNTVVEALERGADDYLVKPVRIRVLDTRIRAVLRRALISTPTTLSYHELEIDAQATLLRKNGESVELTSTEFDLMALLIENAEQTLSRQDLLNKVWMKDYLGDSRLIDASISRLRIKIEDDPAQPSYIQTVRGKGYRLGPIA